MKYSTWAKWLTLSVTAVTIIAFIGMLHGSVEFAPQWPLFMRLSLLNLLVCTIVGLTHEDMDNK